MKTIRKALALMLALCMVLALAACGSGDKPIESKAPESKAPDTTPSDQGGEPTADVELLWWAPPTFIQDADDPAGTYEQKLVEEFNASHPGITVKVETIDFTTASDKITTAIESGTAADVLFDAPGRIIEYGKNGKLVDLGDMFTDEFKKDVGNDDLLTSCQGNGTYYMYPISASPFYMAINEKMWTESGAMEFVNLEGNRAWTTEDFEKAIEKVSASYNPGVLFCGGQGGDQGTRALVNNLYGGTFATASHDQYTWDDDENIKALEQLKSMPGIAFDASLEGGDEIKVFYQGILKMAFCWNIAQQLNPNQADTGAGLTANGEEIVFMGFPAQGGSPALQGGIWGFGIFDNGDQARIENAKTFIKWMCDSEHTVDAVKTANYFAARSAAEGTDLSGIWADNDIMNEYQILMPYLGDYYQVTKGWAGARTEWWTMLQKVGEGADIAETVAAYAANANAADAG